MVSCILITYCIRSLYCSSFPNYFITKIFFSKYIIQYCFYISTYMPIYMNINTTIF